MLDKSLQDWIVDNHLVVEIVESNIIRIDGFGKFLVVSEKEYTFDERFILCLSDEEISLLDTDIDYLLFKFGSLWFYHHKDVDTELNFFRYIGEPSKESYGLPFLGVHGKYELCNGSRDYKDWAKKAKFLGYKSVGICEMQTLAGVQYFQAACKDAGIKPIIGRTSKVKASNGAFYNVKVFVKNQIGWGNLLKIHNIEVVVRDGDNNYISEGELRELSDGLIFVICFDTDLSTVDFNLYNYKDTFYQFSLVQYSSNVQDSKNLLNQQTYINKYINKVKPLILQDSYYLDKIDYPVKTLLNRIANKFTQFKSNDEYFKPFQEKLETLYSFFTTENIDIADRLVDETFYSYEYIDKECTFELVREGKHLPKYIMNEDERLLYSDNEDMFYSLIQKGFNERIKGKVGDESKYLDRVEMEIEVLKEGNVLDYFLILYDVFNFVKREVGIASLGRGSSAGALVSFLLGIVQIDPIKYDLIFERFLSKSRLLSGSLPDIDSDIPSAFRGRVIEYLKDKYGKENVTFISTAQALQLKSTLKDILRLKGYTPKDQNILTSMVPDDFNGRNFEAWFDIAMSEKKIYDVIFDNPDIIYTTYLVNRQPRSFGMHAAGVVIYPSEDDDGNETTAANYVPLRVSDGNLVSEWEKDAIEEGGMLKADLLGLTQLDKIVRINELIKENGKEYLDFLDIDLEDERVMNVFREGLTEDIFQFNTDTLKSYLLDLQPENVDDLIAANALVRPGAMGMNSHKHFVDIKNGVRERDDLPLVNDIVEPTRSLMIYQEQVMNIYRRIAKCDLAEADNFRKIVSSMASSTRYTNEEKRKVIGEYRSKFVDGYRDEGVEEEVAAGVWDKIESFISYSFNKSHSASYTLTGYWTAYYKVYFPLEFYTAALEFVEADNLARITTEIYASNSINLYPPDINKSSWHYLSDPKTNAIYWSLISVKFAGEVTVQTLLDEREENGKYFSFEEFVERAKNTKVNKTVILNFILCGCFDDIENIKEERDRLRLVEQYSVMLKDASILTRFTDDPKHKFNYYWILQQKRLCGLGSIDYFNIFKRNRSNLSFFTEVFYDGYLLQDEQVIGKMVVVGGVLMDVVVRNTRKGQLAQLLLNCNDQSVYVTLWPEQYEGNKDLLEESKGEVLFLNGNVVKDDFKKLNVIQSIDSTRIKIL